MTAILRRLPFFDQPTAVSVRGSRVRVKAHQIVVWVSVSAQDVLTLEAASPRFPAILDTGNTMTFSLKESHLRLWAGLHPRLLPELEPIRHGAHSVPRHHARVWLHRNEQGKRDPALGDSPWKFDPQVGVAVYPDSHPLAPRLPLFGLRALQEGQLHLNVNAERNWITLRTPDLVTWLSSLWS